jgi:hypothetical protein
MSINGVNNPLLANLGTLGRSGETQRTNTNTVPARTTDAQPAVVRAPLKPQTSIANGAATQSAVPAEAPAGTDPTLWSVLTNDERNFFAKTATLGPLTYGRIKAATAAAPPSVRGGRLDVRA